MRIIFARYGELDYSRDCLTEEGKLQTVAIAERLGIEGISKIYASPCGRAVETFIRRGSYSMTVLISGVARTARQSSRYLQIS